ncbi:MAG TPA: hypothetical protein VEB20_23135 [Azospirillaceae bacterium]|nr:hypothetical protein [Azospirillaceae bacterium]
MDKKLLKLTLTSGSSKVFNVLDITKSAQAAGGAASLFSVRALNYGVFFKEPALDGKSQRGKDIAIDTMLYFPYDADRILDGGASVSLNDNRFEAIVREFAQSFGASGHGDATTDRNILQVLKESPSLDPFLLKTNFRRFGIEVPDTYLRITDDEWNAIREHVRKKVQPMIEFGLTDKSAASMKRVDDFIERIWDGSDISSLFPLLSALSVPLSDGAEIIFAWKGVTFFEFQYNRRFEAIRDLAAWLKDGSAPSDYVSSTIRLEIEGRCDLVKQKLRENWLAVAQIVKEYGESYGKLFIRREGAGDFQKFLRNTRGYYVAMGGAFNKIDHSIEIFNTFTSNGTRRRLRSEELEELFAVLIDVLR